MHYRRFASLLLGAWLTGGLFMATVATQNFRSVDRLLARPAAPAAQEIHKLGSAAARALLRYQVAEQNRWYFQTWETAQLALGGLLLAVLLFGSSEGALTLLLPVLMLLMTLVQAFALTPNIVALGRIIDFVPPGQPSAERSRFWLLHSGYAGLELAKWVLGFLLAARLLFRRRRKPEPAEVTARRPARPPAAPAP
jgi:hypothetical protein